MQIIYLAIESPLRKQKYKKSKKAPSNWRSKRVPKSEENKSRPKGKTGPTQYLSATRGTIFYVPTYDLHIPLIPDRPIPIPVNFNFHSLFDRPDRPLVTLPAKHCSSLSL